MTAHSKKLLYLAIALCASSGLSACANMTLAQFPEPKSSSFRPVESRSGISVLAEVIMDETRSKEYFGVHLLENDILAVYVATRNTNSDISLMVRADSVRIAKVGSGSGRGDPERGDRQAGEAFGIAGAVLISPIFIWAAMQQLSDATIVAENFERNKLRTSMVDPGEVVSGFSYFDWKQLKGTDRVEVCWILEDPIDNESFPVCAETRLGG